MLDTGATFRGTGNAGTNKEKTVRQWFVDHDLVESVLYLAWRPPTAPRTGYLFYEDLFDTNTIRDINP